MFRFPVDIDAEIRPKSSVDLLLELESGNGVWGIAHAGLDAKQILTESSSCPINCICRQTTVQQPQSFESRLPARRCDIWPWPLLIYTTQVLTWYFSGGCVTRGSWHSRGRCVTRRSWHSRGGCVTRGSWLSSNGGCVRRGFYPLFAIRNPCFDIFSIRVKRQLLRVFRWTQ